MPQCGKRGDCN